VGTDIPTWRRGGSVLVMDDEELVRDVACRLLRRLGFEAQGVADGQAAIQAYMQAKEAGQPYDVVIMDLTVVIGMGGREACRRLLCFDQEARVILSSGYSTDHIMLHHRNYGFIGALAKPYSAMELAEAVKNAMTSQHLAAASHMNQT